MPDKETDDLVRRLQRAADGYGRGEVELPLADSPTMYRLPKCKSVSLMNHNPNKVELLLDTEVGEDHRFVIEMDSKTAESLLDLLEFTFRSGRGR